MGCGQGILVTHQAEFGNRFRAVGKAMLQWIILLMTADAAVATFGGRVQDLLFFHFIMALKAALPLLQGKNFTRHTQRGGTHEQFRGQKSTQKEHAS